MTYHCFSLGNAINKPRRLSRANVRVNSRFIFKSFLQKHETVQFTHVNVAALLTSPGSANVIANNCSTGPDCLLLAVECPLLRQEVVPSFFVSVVYHIVQDKQGFFA